MKTEKSEKVIKDGNELYDVFEKRGYARIFSVDGIEEIDSLDEFVSTLFNMNCDKVIDVHLYKNNKRVYIDNFSGLKHISVYILNLLAYRISVFMR